MKYTQADGLHAIEIRVPVVVECSKFGAADVFQAHDCTGRLLDDRFGEFISLDETALGAYGELKRARIGNRRLVQNAGGNLNVLPLERRHHVCCRKIHGLQTIGIQPHTHRIFAVAEHCDGADTIDTREGVRDLCRREVRNKQSVARIIGRIEMHHHHQVRR